MKKINTLVLLVGIVSLLTSCATTKPVVIVKDTKIPWKQSLQAEKQIPAEKMPLIDFLNSADFVVKGSAIGTDVINGKISSVDTVFTGTIPAKTVGKLTQRIKNKDGIHTHLKISYLLGGSTVSVYFERQYDETYKLYVGPNWVFNVKTGEKALDFTGVEVVYASGGKFTLPITDQGVNNLLLVDLESLQVDIDLFKDKAPQQQKISTSTTTDIITKEVIKQ